MGDAIRWEIMLSGSNKPLQLLPDAEEEKELSDRDMDDMVSDPNHGSRAVGMLYRTGVFVGPCTSACLPAALSRSDHYCSSYVLVGTLDSFSVLNSSDAF